MKNAVFGQLAKSVYTATIAITIAAIPGTHANWGDRINGKILNDVASTGKMSPTKAKVLIDNDQALKEKLSAIESAESSIDLIYYIFAEDFSSSKFAQKLIDAANRKVKVRILLDYLTNLSRVDLLMALDAHENIEVKLYNKPTSEIIRDAVFVTTFCDDGYDGCSEKKDQKSKLLQQMGNGTDFMSRLFLTGLYSKTLDLAKISVIQGQNFDPAALQSDTETSPEDIAKLKELGKLIWDAKVKGEVSANFKLWMAFQMYGEDIGPIYDMITASVPLDSDSQSSKDWANLTDYTHHKYLLVDGKKFIIGGRNVEDSYHVKTNDMYQGEDKKYIFMDTDFAADVSAKDGERLTRRFDKLYNFSKMTSSLSEVDQVMELDAITRPDLAVQAVMSCKEASILSTCAENAFDALLETEAKSRSIRVTEKLAAISKLAQDFDRLHRTDTQTKDRINDANGLLSEADLGRAQIHYIENLPFSRNSPDTRQYGAPTGVERNANKNMHELLIRGLDQACIDSKNQGPMTVVLHNAYFFPSPNIIAKFGDMMNGTKDCSKLTVKIITNSYMTTDLFPVNAFASAQLKAMFTVHANISEDSKYRKNRSLARKAAKFEYYEYKKGSADDNRSLHSKVSLLGNDLIIGSANLDMRSYAMDTNNGVYIRGAKDLVADYNKYIDELIASGRLTNRSAELMNTSISKDAFIEEQLQVMKMAISDFSPKGAALFVDQVLPNETPEQFKVRQERRTALKALGTDVMNLLYEQTYAGMWPSQEQIKKRRKLDKLVLDLLSTI